MFEWIDGELDNTCSACVPSISVPESNSLVTLSKIANWSASCQLGSVMMLFFFFVMCSSRKNPYSPHKRDWNFLRGVGFCKAKEFKEMYEA